MEASNSIHFDPGKIAVMVRSGSATHPFKLHTPLVLGIATKHPQGLPWDSEMRRPDPDHKEADSLEGLRQPSPRPKATASCFFCFSSFLNLSISINISRNSMHERHSHLGSAKFQPKPSKARETTNISQSCSSVSVRSDHRVSSLRGFSRRRALALRRRFHLHCPSAVKNTGIPWYR